MKAAYPLLGGYYWREETIQKLIKKIPDGQIVIEVDGVVVGCALSIIVNYNKFGDAQSYSQITGNYTFNTHDPNNQILDYLFIIIGINCSQMIPNWSKH
ncbi:MAG: hypothetical protein ABI374_12230 [Ginsengibacter sp.]